MWSQERAQNDLTRFIYVMETQCAISFATNPSSHCLWSRGFLHCVVWRREFYVIHCLWPHFHVRKWAAILVSRSKNYYNHLIFLPYQPASSSSSWCEDGNVLIVKECMLTFYGLIVSFSFPASIHSHTIGLFEEIWRWYEKCEHLISIVIETFWWAQAT